MRTVGQILKEQREKEFYTLEDVEKHTKIRKELLEALEADNYTKLPPTTFIQGFIKNYSKFLNLDSEKLLAVFRRDYESGKHLPLVMDSLVNPLNKKRFHITPSRVLTLIIGIVVVSFFAYLWFEYRQYIGAPSLEVSTPVDQQTVETSTITVEGKTDPESKVLVNNQEIIVDPEGKFKEEIEVNLSVNTVVVTAMGRFGKSAKIERTVFLKK